MHESGYREVIALDVGEAETEAFWRSFLRRPLLGADRRDQASELVGDARRLPAPLPKLAALLEEAGACAFFCVSVSG